MIQGFKSYGQKKTFFTIFSTKKMIFLVISLKLAKIIGVCKVNISFILIFKSFFTTRKYAQIKKFIQNLQRQKVVKNQF